LNLKKKIIELNKQPAFCFEYYQKTFDRNYFILQSSFVSLQGKTFFKYFQGTNFILESIKFCFVTRHFCYCRLELILTYWSHHPRQPEGSLQFLSIN